jgi:hypothetical protein
MPPLWWAGRFQTRFDQWRNDTMRQEIDPQYKPDGLLGQHKLSQEKVAACYIFLELHELCASTEATDSLWVGLRPTIFLLAYLMRNLGVRIQIPHAAQYARHHGQHSPTLS